MVKKTRLSLKSAAIREEDKAIFFIRGLGEGKRVISRRLVGLREEITEQKKNHNDPLLGQLGQKEKKERPGVKQRKS